MGALTAGPVLTGIPDDPSLRTPAEAIPRHAATLLVVREGSAGPEVLMGTRGATSRFMPNSLVFPGGGVDPEDYEASVASPFSPHTQQLLLRGAEPSLAHALGAALARELEEETGLTLGRPPELSAVEYLCRAITPAVRPRRFDARFFVVSEAEIRGSIAGSGELEQLGYISVRQAMARELEFATRGALERLTTWLALSDLERRARRAVPVMRERVWQGD